MVVSSLEVCMDSVDWPQSYCANLCKSVLPDTVMPCSRPPLLADRRPKPPPEQALKCPRCDSTNTKFCYYNNYNLSQPRHFCKSCRRYWTKGGALRNVPVGGGCRKNKRAKKTHTPDNNNNEASTSAVAQSNPTDMPNCSAYEATTMPVTSDPLFFGNALNLTGIPFTRLQQDNPTSFLCGEPTIINPFKNTSLDYSTLSRDQNSVFDPQLSRSLASALYLSAGLDSELQWKLQQHQQQQPQTNKLCFPSEESHNNNNTEAHDFLSFEQHSNATDQKPDVVKNISSTVIKEEPNTTLTPPDWQVPVSEPLFGGDSGSYWNGGAWPDISSFGSTITQLL